MFERLTWDDKKGYGYYPVRDFVYDEAYFKKYIKYAKATIGENLNAFRVSITNKYCQGFVLDVGIGSGSFIEERGNCWGYDVNDTGVAWLKEKGLWFDLYEDSLNFVQGITFFDSLEHIDDIDSVLSRISGQWLIISIPIFKNFTHLLNSKHLRPDEHYHYFTLKGFKTFMKDKGFTLYEVSDGEIQAGREDIYTFVYRRA